MGDLGDCRGRRGGLAAGDRQTRQTRAKPRVSKPARASSALQHELTSRGTVTSASRIRFFFVYSTFRAAAARRSEPFSRAIHPFASSGRNQGGFLCRVRGPRALPPPPLIMLNPTQTMNTHEITPFTQSAFASPALHLRHSTLPPVSCRKFPAICPLVVSAPSLPLLQRCFFCPLSLSRLRHSPIAS